MAGARRRQNSLIAKQNPIKTTWDWMNIFSKIEAKEVQCLQKYSLVLI